MRAVLRRYTGRFSGQLAQSLQRITGLLLLFYLFVHVRTVHALSQGPAAFDRAVGEFNNPFFKLLEIALLGAVVLHALNGIRVILLDYGVRQERQRRLFWILSIGLGAIIFLAGAIPLFIFSVLKR